MEHRLITGGHEYLPFARSCITKLKRLGLPYADQSFEVGGASIKVRIEPGHEYIRIKGEDSGYIATPSNAANPNGVVKDAVGNDISPRADFKVSNKLKVSTQTEKLVGRYDWKSKSGVVTYDHGMSSRYRLNKLVQNTNGAVPDIFVKGNRISTDGIKVSGVGRFHGRYVVVDNHDGDRVTAHIRIGGTWTQLCEFVPATVQIKHWYTGSYLPGECKGPWFFNPAGDTAASLVDVSVRAYALAKVIRLQLTHDDETEEITGAFVVGEEKGKLVTDAMEVDFAPIVPEYSRITYGGFNVTTELGTGQVRLIAIMAAASSHSYVTANGGGREVAIAIDFDKNGAEVNVTYASTVGMQTRDDYQGYGVDRYVSSHNIPGVQYNGMEQSNYLGDDYSSLGEVSGKWLTPLPETIYITSKSIGIHGEFQVRINDYVVAKVTHGGHITQTDNHKLNGITWSAPTNLSVGRLCLVDVDARTYSVAYEHLEMTGVQNGPITGWVTLYNISAKATLKVVIDKQEKYSKLVWEGNDISSNVAMSSYAAHSDVYVLGLNPLYVYYDDYIPKHMWYLYEPYIRDTVESLFIQGGSEYDDAIYFSNCSRKKDQYFLSLYALRPQVSFFVEYRYQTVGKNAYTARTTIVINNGSVLPETEIEKIPLYSTNDADKFFCLDVTVY